MTREQAIRKREKLAGHLSSPVGVLRGSLLKDGKYLDQIMWSIVARDWYQAKAVWESPVN